MWSRTCTRMWRRWGHTSSFHNGNQKRLLISSCTVLNSPRWWRGERPKCFAAGRGIKFTCTIDLESARLHRSVRRGPARVAAATGVGGSDDLRLGQRSEERRVGKECRCRGGAEYGEERE